MKNLVILRKQQGLSQQKLATIIGLASNTICQYENGRRVPDVDTLILIADYFGVSVDYLLDRSFSSANQCESQVIVDDPEERELIVTFRSITRPAKDAIMGNVRTAKMLYSETK